jgi:imidazolonepropionase-like amidohydrolase
MALAPLLRLTGPVLTGPEDEVAGAWVWQGRVHHARPEVPAGTEELRIDGWTVPGLVDMHAHLGIDDDGEPADPVSARAHGRAQTALGVTLIREPGAMFDVGGLAAEDDQPRVLRSGRHLSRTRRYLRGYAVELEPEDLPAEAVRQLGRSDGWVKIVGDWIDRDVGDLAPTFPPEALAAAADAVHAAGGRVTSHTFSEETLPDLLDAGFDCLEHATGMDGATIPRIAAAGTPVVPTLVNVGRFEDYAAQGEAKFPAYAAHMRALRARRYETVGAAHEAGVRLLVGTDSGGVLPQGIYHQELAELRRAGLGDLAVLDAATWSARRFLGAGTLRDGEEADLLVVPRDPRTDITALREPTAVVLRGRRLS